jgi:hypothetical protein
VPAAKEAEPSKPNTASPETDKPPTAKPEETVTAPVTKKAAAYAIFISRKDAKVYVRQNMTPVFDLPITISGDEPLGTHVFTAMSRDEATKPLQWTALSLPATARLGDDVPASRKKPAADVLPVAVPLSQPTAAQALDRITLPPEVMARIDGPLATGSSLIVSDQGITASGETGLGTDFIIRLR